MNSKRASKEGSEQRKMEGKGGGRDEMRDGWRSISRKFVCKCWPVEMESGVFLFWLRDRPQRAPPMVAGREGCRGIHDKKRERLEIQKQWLNDQCESISPGKS